MRIRNAVLYERLLDGHPGWRTIDEMVEIIAGVRPDFIFRAWFVWSPQPNFCEEHKISRQRQICETWSRYAYEWLGKAVRALRRAGVRSIICGAVPVQVLNRDEYDPVKRKWLHYPETWEMALDPRKWGINVSKEEFQCWFEKIHGSLPQNFDCRRYDPETRPAYFPDITNPKVQELLLNKIRAQVNRGCRAMWIDMLFNQAGYLLNYVNQRHPAIRQSIAAANRIVSRVKFMRGRIFVGSWLPMEPFRSPLDFATAYPVRSEILMQRMNDRRWNDLLRRERYQVSGNTLIAFLDWWGSDSCPLAVFSQKLSPDRQAKFLAYADTYFRSKGIVFALHIHGGSMGVGPRRLAWGRFNWYDSLAPEFRTYPTIKQLAMRKLGMKSS